MHGAILLCQLTTGLQLANLAKEKKNALSFTLRGRSSCRRQDIRTGKRRRGKGRDSIALLGIHGSITIHQPVQYVP